MNDTRPSNFQHHCAWSDSLNGQKFPTLIPRVTQWSSEKFCSPPVVRFGKSLARKPWNILNEFAHRVPSRVSHDHFVCGATIVRVSSSWNEERRSQKEAPKSAIFFSALFSIDFTGRIDIQFDLLKSRKIDFCASSAFPPFVGDIESFWIMQEQLEIWNR